MADAPMETEADAPAAGLSSFLANPPAAPLGGGDILNDQLNPGANMSVAPPAPSQPSALTNGVPGNFGGPQLTMPPAAVAKAKADAEAWKGQENGLATSRGQAAPYPEWKPNLSAPTAPASAKPDTSQPQSPNLTSILGALAKADPKQRETFLSTLGPALQTQLRAGLSTMSGGGTGGSGVAGSAPRKVGGQSGPGPLQEVEQGIAGQQSAIKDAAVAGAARATEQATYLQHTADAADALQTQQLAKQNARDQLFQDQMKKLEQVSSDYQKISTTVDPNRYMGSKSFMDQMTARIGVFLGGLGGGDNPALKNIHSAIDRDIDAQKTQISANLEKGKEAIQNRVTLYGMYRQKGLDDVQAEAATRATMLDNAARHLDAMGKKYDAPEIKAKAAQGVASLTQAAGEARNTFANQAQEIAQKWADVRTRQAGVGVEAMKAQAEAAKVGQVKGGDVDGAVDLVNKLGAQQAKGNPIAGALGVGEGGKYNHMVDAYAPLIAQKLMGSNRAPTPEMIKYVKDELPGLMASKGRAKEKLQVIRDALAARASSSSTPGAGSGLDLREEE